MLFVSLVPRETSLDQPLNAVVISIPIMLLWNVRITLRHKLALWGVLCLSIFTALTSIIKVAGGNINNGQVDAAWAVFWLQAEAAVAVIVVSISAFRALFVAQRASKQASPAAFHTRTSSSLLRKRFHLRNTLPEVPSPTFTGVRTFTCQDDEESQNLNIPLQGSGIRVTQNNSSELVRCMVTSYHSTETDLFLDRPTPWKQTICQDLRVRRMQAGRQCSRLRGVEATCVNSNIFYYTNLQNRGATHKLAEVFAEGIHTARYLW